MSRSALTLALLCVAAGLFACRARDDFISAPTRSTAVTVAPAPPVTDKSGRQDVVQVLKRSKPLQQAVTASATIGPEGGVLRLDDAGVWIEFGPGAVSTRTLITITALAGKEVAYEFAPHGLTFTGSVVVHQDLRKTVAGFNTHSALQLQGAYFDGDLDGHFVDPQHDYARIDESRPASVNDDATWLAFTIKHFSGYLLSSGRAAGVEID
jgi:hypothetical protein